MPAQRRLHNIQATLQQQSVAGPIAQQQAGHLRPHTADLDPPGAGSGLSSGEVAFFKEHGFICKRGLIPATVLQPHIDHIMTELTQRQPSVCVGDRATWVDPHKRPTWAVTEGSFTADGRKTARNWPMTFTPQGDWRWHGLGTDTRWLDATSAHDNVMRVVESLIGGPVMRPTRNRGIYTLFPKSEPELPQLNPHHDYHPFDLGGMIYLSEVGPGSGGTALWPGSHLRILRTLPCEQRSGFQPTEEYHAAVHSAKRKIQPVEICGGVGDVLFFHPALLHSGGINSARDGNGGIRIASPQDFQRCRPDKSFLMYETEDGRRPALDGTLPLGAGTVEEDGGTETRLIWHHDTMEYAPFQRLDQGDLWAGWNLRGRQVAGETADVAVQPSWWEKHGLESPTPVVRLDELALWDRSDGLWRLKSD